MLDRFVAYNARSSGNDIAFSSLSQDRSYALLEATISRLARALEGLRGLDLKRVAVHCSDVWRHWALTLALGRLGLASASLSNGEVSDEELAALRPDLIVTDNTGVLPPVEGRLILAEEWFERILFGVEEDDCSNYYPPVSVEKSAPCRIALATGTGRDMQLLELTFGEVERQLHRFMYHDMVEFFSRNSQNKDCLLSKPQLLCSIGPQSLSGFLMVGAALSGGSTLRSSDSRSIGGEVMRSSSSLMIVMTPVHLEQLLRILPPGMQPMGHVYLSVVGGKLTEIILEQTRMRFTPYVQVIYGTDETGPVASIRAEQRQSEDNVGPLLPWAEVEVVDDEGRNLLPNEIGEIRIRGGVTNGYLENGSTVAQRFRGGWFYPGDRGFLSPEGMLHLRGRVDTLVNAGGAKFDLEVMENILRSEPRITDVGVFTMEDKQGVERFYAAIVSHETFDDEALSTRLRRRYAALPPVIMIWVQEIPRTLEGHVDRTNLRVTLRNYIRYELKIE
ncbi:acyl--CoA ligase [Bombella sp. TMW 2.2559]|uniref:Acyl--CoA ligase n=1 Tax=Bombella dulcis TaxID=2967339 RepID=A0ABT3WFH1_9PROT|nr:class I adenylate-forming enzyme family protein [Bombella dulcis]MCX5616529.1 acyl--CoA ligase [Bombella dulcis]